MSAPERKTTRGLTTTAAVYRRCKVEKGCWLWTGAVNDNRHPVIHSVDYQRGDKRTMAGTRAVWNMAFGVIPEGKIVYRCCAQPLCLNPRHLRLASSKREMFAAIKGAPQMKRDRAQVIAAAHKGHRAQGQKHTPVEIVLAIKRAPPRSALPNNVLAAQLGCSVRVVSDVRLGKSYRDVAA